MRQAASSCRPPDRPARRADQAEQHDQRIGIDIARLDARRDPVADADRKSRAVRAEAVDRLLIAALPEQAGRATAPGERRCSRTARRNTIC